MKECSTSEATRHPGSTSPTQMAPAVVAAAAADATTAAEGIQGRHRAAATGATRDAAAAAAGTRAGSDTAAATGNGASRDAAATTTEAVCTDVPLAPDRGGGRRHRSRAVRAERQEKATRIQGDLPRR